MKILLIIIFLPLYVIFWLLWVLPTFIYRQIKIKGIEGGNFRIYIAGTQYKNDDGTDRQRFIKKCKVGEELILVKTPSKYDDYGIQIYRKNGECLGWVPAKYSYEFATEMERDRIIQAFFYGKIKPERDFNYYSGKVTIIKQ